jgi:threonine/homoserine/homoserine lactone efflux protein
MTALTFILKGFIIGIVAAIPVGPILMMTLQKSVTDGRKAGFSCGLGGTAVDTVCAIVSAFAISGIGSFVDAHATAIEIIGGLFIMFVGFNMFRSRMPKERMKKSYSPKSFIKAATMGFSNPAALAVMLALFATFGMDMGEQPAWVPVLAIAALATGSALYWFCVSGAVARLGDRFNLKVLHIINKVAAAGVFIFGVILLVKGIISML